MKTHNPAEYTDVALREKERFNQTHGDDPRAYDKLDEIYQELLLDYKEIVIPKNKDLLEGLKPFVKSCMICYTGGEYTCVRDANEIKHRYIAATKRLLGRNNTSDKDKMPKTKMIVIGNDITYLEFMFFDIEYIFNLEGAIYDKLFK